MPVVRAKLLASYEAPSFLLNDDAMNDRNLSPFAFPLADRTLRYAKDCAQPFKARIQEICGLVDGMYLSHDVCFLELTVKSIEPLYSRRQDFLVTDSSVRPYTRGMSKKAVADPDAELAVFVKNARSP